MERAETSLSDLIESAKSEKEKIRKGEIEAKAKKTEEVEATPEGEILNWNVTPEQIAKINAGDRAALDEFYLDPENMARIKYTTYMFMRRYGFLRASVSWEDLFQQFYCDLRTGMLKLRPYNMAITEAAFTSFRYAAVGGLDEIYVSGRWRRGKK